MLRTDALEILNEVMTAFGMAPADRDKAISALVDTLAYVGDGLAGSDSENQLGPVRRPSVMSSGEGLDLDYARGGIAGRALGEGH